MTRAIRVRNFELLVAYPGSPEVGEVAQFQWNGGNYNYLTTNAKLLKPSDVEGWPDYWQETTKQNIMSAERDIIYVKTN